jgi:hypothetical protein
MVEDLQRPRRLPACSGYGYMEAGRNCSCCPTALPFCAHGHTSQIIQDQGSRRHSSQAQCLIPGLRSSSPDCRVEPRWIVVLFLWESMSLMRPHLMHLVSMVSKAQNILHTCDSFRPLRNENIIREVSRHLSLSHRLGLDRRGYLRKINKGYVMRAIPKAGALQDTVVSKCSMHIPHWSL